MFVINRFADAMFPCRLCCRFGKGGTPDIPFFIKVIVKLYVISDDGRQVAVAELRADKLEDEIKEGMTSIRCVFEESVTISTVGIRRR